MSATQSDKVSIMIPRDVVDRIETALRRSEKLAGRKLMSLEDTVAWILRNFADSVLQKLQFQKE